MGEAKGLGLNVALLGPWERCRAVPRKFFLCSSDSAGVLWQNVTTQGLITDAGAGLQATLIGRSARLNVRPT